MATHFGIIFYLALLSLNNGQYVEIWYDDMASQNGWSATNNGEDVDFGRYSVGCTDEPCTRTGTSNYGYSVIDKSTDISGYSYIQLRFDVSSWDFEDNEKCQVYYAYNSPNNKQFLEEYGGFNDERTYFDNQFFTLPLDASATTLWIFFKTIGDTGGADQCYWDNVYLRGIPVTTTKSPTNKPTTLPTKMPITSPTQKPSPAPTNNPTLSPTSAPNTKPPTNKPTSPPTKKPTVESTNAPTRAPATDPTQDLFVAPTNNPLRSPTAVPSYDPSPLSTEDPTISLTSAATDNPTNDPTTHSSTAISTVPSVTLTKAPNQATTTVPDTTTTSNVATTDTTRTIEITKKETNVKTNSELQINDTLVTMIIFFASGLLVTSCICICIYLLCSKKCLWSSRDTNETETVQMIGPKLQQNIAEAVDNDAVVMSHIQTQGPTPMDLHKRANRDALELQHWFQNIVELPQYFDTFMNAGYESMDFVKAVSNIEEVIEMGIECNEHQIKIFEEIVKLKGEEYNEYNERERKGEENNECIASQPRTSFIIESDSPPATKAAVFNINESEDVKERDDGNREMSYYEMRKFLGHIGLAKYAGNFIYKGIKTKNQLLEFDVDVIAVFIDNKMDQTKFINWLKSRGIDAK